MSPNRDPNPRDADRSSSPKNRQNGPLKKNITDLPATEPGAPTQGSPVLYFSWGHALASPRLELGRVCRPSPGRAGESVGVIFAESDVFRSRHGLLRSFSPSGGEYDGDVFALGDSVWGRRRSGQQGALIAWRAGVIAGQACSMRDVPLRVPCGTSRESHGTFPPRVPWGTSRDVPRGTSRRHVPCGTRGG